MNTHEYYKRNEERKRRGTAMSTYVRLSLGQPLEAVLQDPNGLATTSPTDRPQVEYKLADGRTLCATPFQAGKIRKLNPRAGDRLRLLMSKNAGGKSITEVQLFPPPASIPATPARSVTPPTPSSDQGRAGREDDAIGRPLAALARSTPRLVDTRLSSMSQTP